MTVVVAALAVSACEGIQPGDYRVYRVAFERSVRSEGCPGGQSPPDDTSTELTPGTWIIYMGPDELPYLDIGNTTLRGEGSGDELTFDGRRVDVTVNDDGMGNTQTITTTHITHVTLTVDGASVQGTMQETDDQQCSGSGCPEPTNCTITRDLVGSEVEDVELQHEV
jgi:hypothetical protein